MENRMSSRRHFLTTTGLGCVGLSAYQQRFPASLSAAELWNSPTAAGPVPDKTPLNARTTRVIERDAYRIENVIFESRPGYFVTANLCGKRTASRHRAMPAMRISRAGRDRRLPLAVRNTDTRRPDEA